MHITLEVSIRRLAVGGYRFNDLRVTQLCAYWESDLGVLTPTRLVTLSRNSLCQAVTRPPFFQSSVWVIENYVAYVAFVVAFCLKVIFIFCASLLPYFLLNIGGRCPW